MVQTSCCMRGLRRAGQGTRGLGGGSKDRMWPWRRPEPLCVRGVLLGPRLAAQSDLGPVPAHPQISSSVTRGREVAKNCPRKTTLADLCGNSVS